MFPHLIEDWWRCGNTTASRLREMIFNPAMWAVLSYRFRRWVALSRIPWPLNKAMGLVASCVQLYTDLATSITLPATAAIGPGLYLPHPGYIVVGSRAIIGRHCTIAQGVTIGHGGGGSRGIAECPIVGDRVYVGPGAILIGPIAIGDDSLIGAGAVVTRSVPERGVVVGNPARLLSRRGSFDLIDYPGRETDPDRVASLAEVRSETGLVDREQAR